MNEKKGPEMGSEWAYMRGGTGGSESAKNRMQPMRGVLTGNMRIGGWGDAGKGERGHKEQRARAPAECT
jgi:hypothetical protein